MKRTIISHHPFFSTLYLDNSSLKTLESIIELDLLDYVTCNCSNRCLVTFMGWVSMALHELIMSDAAIHK